MDLDSVLRGSFNDSIIGGWEKLKVVGKGGSSVVYKGCVKKKSNDDDNTNKNEIIAIKEVSSDGLSDDQIKGFMNEIMTIKDLSHKNIIRYIGAQKEKDRFYIFLDYADRGSLRQFYLRNGALRESQASNTTRQILKGLKYLHNNGIAHRDVKGANVLLCSNGLMKLADFGASKRIGSESIVSGLKGTPQWMAPEVIKGNITNIEWTMADIWSVGCTVIEMLTASIPYAEYDNPMTAMYHIANGKLPSIIEYDGEDNHDNETINSNTSSISGTNKNLPLKPFSRDVIDFIKGCMVPTADDRCDATDLMDYVFILKASRKYRQQSSSSLSSSTSSMKNSNTISFENKQIHNNNSHNKALDTNVDGSQNQNENAENILNHASSSHDSKSISTISTVTNNNDNNIERIQNTHKNVTKKQSQIDNSKELSTVQSEGIYETSVIANNTHPNTINSKSNGNTASTYTSPPPGSSKKTTPDIHLLATSPAGINIPETSLDAALQKEGSEQDTVHEISGDIHIDLVNDTDDDNISQPPSPPTPEVPLSTEVPPTVATTTIQLESKHDQRQEYVPQFHMNESIMTNTRPSTRERPSAACGSRRNNVVDIRMNDSSFGSGTDTGSNHDMSKPRKSSGVTEKDSDSESDGDYHSNCRESQQQQQLLLHRQSEMQSLINTGSSADELNMRDSWRAQRLSIDSVRKEALRSLSMSVEGNDHDYNSNNTSMSNRNINQMSVSYSGKERSSGGSSGTSHDLEGSGEHFAFGSSMNTINSNESLRSLHQSNSPVVLNNNKSNSPNFNTGSNTLGIAICSSQDRAGMLRIPTDNFNRRVSRSAGLPFPSSSSAPSSTAPTPTDRIKMNSNIEEGTVPLYLRQYDNNGDCLDKNYNYNYDYIDKSQNSYYTDINNDSNDRCGKQRHKYRERPEDRGTGRVRRVPNHNKVASTNNLRGRNVRTAPPLSRSINLPPL